MSTLLDPTRSQDASQRDPRRGNDGINKLIKIHTQGTRNDLHQISQGFTVVEIKPFYSAFNEAVLNHTKLHSSVFPSGSISSRTPAWFRRRRHKSDADGSDVCRYSVQMFRLL